MGCRFCVAFLTSCQRERQRISPDFPVCVAFRRSAWPGKATFFDDCLDFRCLLGFLPAGKATDFGVFLDLRCLFSFLPAVKATDFAGFHGLRCLSPLSWPGKATNFGTFLDFRCLFSFLPAVKATDFAGFPGLCCLSPLFWPGKARFFDDFFDLRCLFGFLPAVKATDFAGFPGLRCLSPRSLLMWFVSLDKKFLFLQAESNFLSETDLFRQKKTFRARETHAQKVLFNNFCSVDPGFLRIVLTKSTPDFSRPELLPLCRLFLSYHVFCPM